MSYPRTGDGGGSGEVAYGLRLSHLSTQGDSGFRFALGGNFPTWYEVFYDVYLKSASGGTYTYEYRYWYRQVKKYTSGTPGAVGPGLTNPWVPFGTIQKVIPVPAGPGITTLNSIAGLGVSLPSLPLRGTVEPKSPTSYNPKPTDFGWNGTGSGTSPGSPRQGIGGGAPFITLNPFGYKKPGDTDGSSPGGRDNGAKNNDDTTETTDDDPYRSEGGKIPGFTTNKGRKLYLNPPPVITVTGAYVPVVYDWEGNAVSVDEREPETRQSLLGYGTYTTRMRKKATIKQWIKIADEWRVKQGGTATDKKGKTSDSWSTDQAIVPNGKQYGFRFMYNPSEISFQMSPVPGIDPGVIISGLGRSYPMGDEDGGSIQITTYLNRIEDMAFLRPKGDGYVIAGVNPYGSRDLSDEHKKGIATRGTGWDLEFLFRTTLGKPYNTKTRGMTADIGLILGVPLLLSLGGGMVYTGRLTGLSYNHMYFTSEMVPTFTQVTMSFTRFPDATSFNDEPNPGGKGNNKPGKKK